MDSEGHLNNNENWKDKYIVDSIEGNIVTLEDMEVGNTKNIELDSIIGEIIEGDVVSFEDGKYFYDKERTIYRREKVSRLFKRVLGLD